MNDLTKKEAPDRSKINLHDPLRAKAWSHELGVTTERLIENWLKRSVIQPPV